MMSSEVQGEVDEFGFYPVPQVVLDIATAGIARMQLAAGQEEFVFETSTTAITGHGENVISVKRGNYYDLRIEANSDFHLEELEEGLDNEANIIESLQRRIGLLEAELQTQKAQIAAEAAAEEEEEEEEKDSGALSLVGLIIAIVACLLSLYNFYTQSSSPNGYKSASTNNGHDTELMELQQRDRQSSQQVEVSISKSKMDDDDDKE